MHVTHAKATRFCVLFLKIPALIIRVLNIVSNLYLPNFSLAPCQKNAKQITMFSPTKLNEPIKVSAMYFVTGLNETVYSADSNLVSFDITAI